ncbi:hypothetical protein KCP76_08560 [Salmonella enterica subsp. enterica serovar Weltevreden]|nr:hypothetical protein KCP76_08560 [Salmonella enterica subsp. enterica serovar Weltevreden]
MMDGFMRLSVNRGKRGMRQREQALLLTRLAIIDRYFPAVGSRRGK